LINNTINAAIVKHLNTTEQLQFAITADWQAAHVAKVFGASSVISRIKDLVTDGGLSIEGVSADEYLNDAALTKAIADGRASKPRASKHDRAPVPNGLHEAAQKEVNRLIAKAAVAPTTTGNTPALYYPGQASGVLLPPISPSIISALVALGAPELPPNVRLLTQAANLSAVEVAEGAPIPAAAPSLAFSLTATDRKFALIVAYGVEMLAASNFDTRVQAYVQEQLTIAANNATDTFLLGLFDAGTAATTVAGAIAAFAGDLRTACWVGNPETFAGLRSAQETNIGPMGGTFYQLPAISSVAAAANKLYLVDRKRVALFDGPMEITASGQASILMDSAPGTAEEAVSNLYQENKVALKVVKYADAKLLTPAQAITLA